MPAKQTRFEVVPIQEVIALLAKSNSATPPRVLSISYDQALARTRELILTAAGIKVRTSLELKDALRLLSKERFDLVILGHSIPVNERQVMADRVRMRSEAPILAISRAGERPPVQAEHQFDAGLGPRELLHTVRRILKIKTSEPSSAGDGESGDEASVSGIYELLHADHVAPESVVIKGDVFPDCSKCSSPIQFKLLVAAPSLDEDPDFQHSQHSEAARHARRNGHSRANGS